MEIAEAQIAGAIHRDDKSAMESKVVERFHPNELLIVFVEQAREGRAQVHREGGDLSQKQPMSPVE